MSFSDSSAPLLLADRSLKTGETALTVWMGPLIATAIAGIVALVAFRETVASIVTIWSGSSTYSYGFVIAPICAFLTWRRMSDLNNVQPRPSLLGLGLFVLSALLWLVGNVADVQLIQHIALVAMFDTLVWAFLGTTVVRVLRFPLLFLFLAVPVGDSLVPHLQKWTAAFAVGALRISGIPAFQDGLVLSTPTGNWQVAEACSGIRYLIASIVIGVLVAGTVYRSWKRRIAFLLFSALLPIIANSIRAYGIVVLAYFFGNSIASGVDHVIYGFVFFSLLTTILLAVALRWYEPSSLTRRTSTPDANFMTAPARLFGILVAIVLIAASATTLAGFLWSRTPVIPIMPKSINAPAGWAQTEDTDYEWAPEPTSMRFRTTEKFVSGPREVSICSGSYPGNRRGVELINSSNAVGISHTWTLLESGTRETVIAGEPVVVTEHTIVRGLQHRIVWTWYSIGNQLTADPYRLRVIQAKNRLFAHPQNTSLFAASAAFQSDPSEAGRVLAEFLK